MSLRLSLFVVAWILSPFGFAQDARPNILLIVADDLGYADLGVFGGGIRTPNIDALARNGILFTQFHASPLCATTRAMLLSGNNNVVAGMARQGGSPFLVNRQLAGYENFLSDRIAPLPRLLADAGYRTYWAGKWHLGSSLEHSPHAAGFQRSFALKFGFASHYENFPPGLREGPDFFDNDQHALWPDAEYSTEFYTDKLIEYLELDRDSDDPFFMVAAYTSPHWPLQVPDEDLDLYAGRYDMGYDRLRELRFESLKDAGIIPQESQLPPRNPAVVPFAELDPEAQRKETRKMELYASMVDNLDRHIGRLLDYLRDKDLYDDTLIVFMSDNGAAGEDFYNSPVYSEYMRTHYDNSSEHAGTRNSFLSYGPQWAEAGSAPFKLYKGFLSEGGMVAPMIVSGAGITPGDEPADIYLTVMDLAPTFLEVAAATYPNDKAPLLGESALPFFAGAANTIHADDYVTTLTHRQRAFVRQGDWKLLTLDQPFDERDFALYNLADDPGETTDLSDSNPGKRDEMLRLWRQQRLELGIVLPEDL